MWGSLHAPCVACPLYRVGMQVEDQDVAQLAGEKSRNHEIFCWEQELDQKASTAYLVPLLKEPLQKELLPACRQKPHLHIACKVQPPTSRNTWPKKRVFKNGMASVCFQKKKKKKNPQHMPNNHGTVQSSDKCTAPFLPSRPNILRGYGSQVMVYHPFLTQPSQYFAGLWQPSNGVPPRHSNGQQGHYSQVIPC
jgi:hypothetical protein